MKEQFNLANIAKHFSDPEAARGFFEKQRWPDGPVCPHCGPEAPTTAAECRTRAKFYTEKAEHLDAKEGK